MSVSGARSGAWDPNGGLARFWTVAAPWLKTGVWLGVFAVANKMIQTQLSTLMTRRRRRTLLKNDVNDQEGTGPQAVKMELTEHEAAIAENIVDAATIDSVTFDTIGGLEHQKQEIYDSVILPLKRPDLFAHRSSLVSSPRGILLYGAPGTGKTMLAKAIARESGASFINLTMSNMMNKYFGESNKLVSAVFSLARKISPAIIFIDEIDAFLRDRGQDGDSPMGPVKAEFMTHWDGLLTDKDATVIVLGATNRPFAIDAAILRRLPRSFEIGLPDTHQRVQILQLLLRGERIGGPPEELCAHVAKITPSYSGSDLKELCRAALMEAIREAARANREGDTEGAQTLRPLRRADFDKVLDRVPPTGAAAAEYLQRTRRARRAAEPRGGEAADEADAPPGQGVLANTGGGEAEGQILLALFGRFLQAAMAQHAAAAPPPAAGGFPPPPPVE